MSCQNDKVPHKDRKACAIVVRCDSLGLQVPGLTYWPGLRTDWMRKDEEYIMTVMRFWFHVSTMDSDQLPYRTQKHFE